MGKGERSTSFRGFVWEPGSEQEVVCLFGVLLQDLPWPLAIDEIRTEYPDCLAQRVDTGQRLRIEFELHGSQFWSHGHDPDECDVVVCWYDNYEDWPAGITVVELANIVRSKRPNLIQNTRPKREARLWDEDSFEEEANPEVWELIRDLKAKISSEPTLILRYNAKSKKAQCNVCLCRNGTKLLWIWADGSYQWDWYRFRGTQPQVVALFQQLVGSKNKSSKVYAKGAIVQQTAGDLLDVLQRVAEAAERC